MSRLRSDFWVAAFLRRCSLEGVDAVLRRRGAAEAGAVFVKIDHLNGTATLYGPAPQSLVEGPDAGRLFAPILKAVPPPDVEERMKREMRFDSDLWLLEIDNAEGRHFLDLAPEDA